MLVHLSEILKDAERKQIAAGAFNITNWETAAAVCAAAEETETAVILEYAPVHSSFLNIHDAAEIMLYFAKKTSVPIGVHLDHGNDFDICMQAIRLGFTSVMIDASTLPYADNIRETAEAVKAAHATGVSVEAEIGRILTSENGALECGSNIETERLLNTDNIYTDPAAAKDFVEKTHVDALAVAFGTAHGIYKTKPKLDLERIKKIREVVDLPLVMHGGSGLSKEEFYTAVKNGIRKINYYTYMSLAGGKAVKAALGNASSDDSLFFHDISLTAADAMKNDAKNAILMFSGKL